MIVVLAEEAEGDLEAIGAGIGHDSPRRAQSFVGELGARCLKLADQPRAYPLVPRYERLAVRRRPWRDHLIFYQIEEDRIVVVRILHGSQDYETLLFPDS